LLAWLRIANPVAEVAGGVSASPYLLAVDVAERWHCSIRTVHERTRLREVPHRVLPGSRRVLFVAADLDAWEAGAPLEAVELPRGGRVVRPRGKS
jgi:hypothetical protein